MAYTQLLYHIIFRTKNSVDAISIENERQMYYYLYTVCQDMKCVVHRIGGMPDHIHILVSLPATLTVAQFVEKIKVASSTKFKANNVFPLFDGWSSSYAALTYAFSDRGTVAEYIKNQKVHHIGETFLEEYRKLITSAGIDIDEQYFP